MSAKQNLLNAYESWEQLTHHESAAISRADWPGVSECQKNKQELQRSIIHLTDAARAESDEAGVDKKRFDTDLRQIVNRLIALENNNSELISERRQTAELQRAELDQTSRNLRRMQKSYAQPASAVWQSYS
jgi:hypothetical protein